MLIRLSGEISQGVHLFTLGSSCHYMLAGKALFDPGLTIQFPLLVKRIENAGASLLDLQYVFLTHLHADRIAAAAMIKKINPEVQIVASHSIKQALAKTEIKQKIYADDLQFREKFKLNDALEPLDFNDFSQCLDINLVVRHGDAVKIDHNNSVRVMNVPSHTPESLVFYINPSNFLIVDEGLGYYHGNRLATPGADHSFTEMETAINKLINLQIAGLCLPTAGVLTGNLITKFFKDILINTKDMFDECFAAHKDGVEDAVIKESVWESFYKPEIDDAISMTNSQRSFEATWAKILEDRIKRQAI